MIRLTRIFAILSKEMRQLRRDRLTFGMIIGIPLIQILMFGYAINTDVRHLTGAVADQAETVLSRELLAAVQATQVVDFDFRVATAAELEALLLSGDIDIGLFIPDDAQRRFQVGQRPVAQLLINGSDPLIVSAAVQLRNLPFDPRHRSDPQQRDGTLAVRYYYNTERRSAVYIIPGLIGVILTLTMVLFTAVAIVRERERGNLELLITTPVLTIELMIGKIVPYIFIGLIQTTIVLAVGAGLFSVPINGALIDVYLATGVFIVASLSLGLMISTLASNQFQAMQMTFFVLLPSILLSGFMFPYDGMPLLAQWIAEVLPLTHFLRLIRGVVLRGADLSILMEDVWELLAFAGVMMSLAILRFRKRLD
jgi:ABC-2 type transport system permease protein